MVMGEVRVAENLDGLMVTPREIREVHGLSGLLRDTLPSGRLHRRAGSFHLAGADVDDLFSVSAQMPEFRWTPEAVRFVINRQQARRVHPRLLGQVRELRSASRR